MDKYYTPKIEEFCVGFEYDVCYNDFEDSWTSDVVEYIRSPEYKLSIPYYAIEQDLIRVKCLDKIDIEELGWRYKENDGKYRERFILKEYDDHAERYNTHELLLHYGIENNPGFKDLIQEFPTVIITIEPAGGHYYEGFHGSVKNKSELKKLMKQLGI